MKQEIMQKYEEIYLKNHDYDDYDDDSDILEEPEELQAINLLNSIETESIIDFRKDTTELAKYYIKLFFETKDAHFNHRIDKNILFNEERILKVINTSIIAGVQQAYEALSKCIIITQEDINKAKKSGDVTQEIRLVNETLKSLYKAGIPQQFAGGMMILYLEFCEGINFGA